MYGYNYYYYYLVYFPELVDNIIKIPVNEFYEISVQRQVISRILPEVHQDLLHSHQALHQLRQALLLHHHGFENYLFGNVFGNYSGGLSPHGGLELFDRR